MCMLCYVRMYIMDCIGWEYCFLPFQLKIISLPIVDNDLGHSQIVITIIAFVRHGLHPRKLEMLLNTHRIFFPHPYLSCCYRSCSFRSHRNLVQGFFSHASRMLRPYGEVHVSHKTSEPYDRWNLEELASQCSLILAERVNFKKADYPGYNNKRGDGARCDEPFHLGECCTFKFRINTRKEKTASEANASYIWGQSLPDITETQHTIPRGETLEGSQFDSARSFNGNDRLVCYRRTNDPSSMLDMFGALHGHTSISSRNDHPHSVGYQAYHTTALSEIPGNRHGNLRHLEENDYSLSVRYQGFTSALPVMQGRFNHADAIDISPEFLRILHYFRHNDEMFGRTDYDFRRAIWEFLTRVYEMYMNEQPERIHGYARNEQPERIHSYVGWLQELQYFTNLRLKQLRMLLGSDE